LNDHFGSVRDLPTDPNINIFIGSTTLMLFLTAKYCRIQTFVTKENPAAMGGADGYKLRFS